jgi:hypothetical protein
MSNLPYGTLVAELEHPTTVDDATLNYAFYQSAPTANFAVAIQGQLGALASRGHLHTHRLRSNKAELLDCYASYQTQEPPARNSFRHKVPAGATRQLRQ